MLRTDATGAYTVADALNELAEFDRSAWPWLANEGAILYGWYLRARHSELVRDH
ncbi:hypothetical protein ACWFRB_08805 [Rhodococcus sp. NPDC055112]